MIKMIKMIEILLLFAVSAQAQIVRLRPKPNYFIPGTMAISATPGAVNFNLVKSGIAPASQSITVSTQWLIGINATVNLYGFFASTNALATAANDYIVSSDVWGQCSTGTATSFTPFSQSGPFATGSSLLLFSRSVLVSINENHTDVVSLQIDLNPHPQQPAGTYSGQVIFQIQAF